MYFYNAVRQNFFTSNNQLQEWNADFDEVYPDHRHTSHLLAVHPFNIIDPEADPVLRKAILKTLERRLGDNAREIVLFNFAGAQLITYYARLLEKEKAEQFVVPMIAYLSRPNMMITHQGPTTSVSGGIYELDGNTGFTAAIAEMLMQSYTGSIHILPGVPDSWSHGEFKGLVAYGGHVVDAKWDDKKVEVTLHSSHSDSVTLKYGSQSGTYTLNEGEVVNCTVIPNIQFPSRA